MLDNETPAHGIILGIDPGTVTMGYCAMTVDLRTLERVRVDTFTIDANRPKDGQPACLFMPENHSALFQRMREHGARLTAVLQDWQPFQIAVELPFFSALQATAYGPLVQLFSTIQNTIYDYNPWLTLYQVENTVTKAMVYPDTKQERKRIRDSYKTTKERIAACVQQHQDFAFIDTTTLDEHEIDACLVAEWRRRQLMIGILDQV